MAKACLVRQVHARHKGCHCSARTAMEFFKLGHRGIFSTIFLVIYQRHLTGSGRQLWTWTDGSSCAMSKSHHRGLCSMPGATYHPAAPSAWPPRQATNGLSSGMSSGGSWQARTHRDGPHLLKCRMERCMCTRTGLWQALALDEELDVAYGSQTTLSSISVQAQEAIRPRVEPN